MSNFPTDLRYHSDHLWARPSGEHLVRVGVSDFAQRALGDVLNVTLPAVAEKITAGEPCGQIESTKSVSDLVAPVTGTIRKRNEALAAAPELVNTAPYGDGWLFEVEVDAASERDQLTGLLDAAAYRHLVGD
ncbi:MAG TPA: glycine cleavage system protein GcvH [Candidatus Binatia bacterium]|jgi:glycine cleavage system H protein